MQLVCLTRYCILVSPQQKLKVEVRKSEDTDFQNSS